jgi:hypothetical protein
MINELRAVFDCYEVKFIFFNRNIYFRSLSQYYQDNRYVMIPSDFNQYMAMKPFQLENDMKLIIQTLLQYYNHSNIILIDYEASIQQTDIFYIMLQSVGIDDHNEKRHSSKENEKKITVIMFQLWKEFQLFFLNYHNCPLHIHAYEIQSFVVHNFNINIHPIKCYDKNFTTRIVDNNNTMLAPKWNRTVTPLNINLFFNDIPIKCFENASYLIRESLRAKRELQLEYNDLFYVHYDEAMELKVIEKEEDIYCLDVERFNAHYDHWMKGFELLYNNTKSYKCIKN